MNEVSWKGSIIPSTNIASCNFFSVFQNNDRRQKQGIRESSDWLVNDRGARLVWTYIFVQIFVQSRLDFLI